MFEFNFNCGDGPFRESENGGMNCLRVSNNKQKIDKQNTKLYMQFIIQYGKKTKGSFLRQRWRNKY